MKTTILITLVSMLSITVLAQTPTYDEVVAMGVSKTKEKSLHFRTYLGFNLSQSKASAKRHIERLKKEKNADPESKLTLNKENYSGPTCSFGINSIPYTFDVTSELWFKEDQMMKVIFTFTSIYKDEIDKDAFENFSNHFMLSYDKYALAGTSGKYYDETKKRHGTYVFYGSTIIFMSYDKQNISLEFLDTTILKKAMNKGKS